MNKVVLIIPYYGNFPQYFDVWIKSCQKNPQIDFLIITDEDLENYDIPENIKVLPLAFQQISMLASERIGFSVELSRPYKLCDYKPAYGLIFEEYINGYEYWGHCDLDLVWGNIIEILDKHHFQEFDKFSDRGHLTLYRNTPEINRVFMTELDHVSYKKVYTSDKSQYFDESGVNYLFEKLGKKVFDRCTYCDVNLFYHDIRHADHPDKPHNYKNQVFVWDNGEIYQYYKYHNAIKKTKWMYLHFQKRNLATVTEDLGDKFLITNRGFINFPHEITESTFKIYNPRGTFVQNLQRTEYVYTGKTHLTGLEFFKFLLLRSYSVMCNSALWKSTLGKVWVKIRS